MTPPADPARYKNHRFPGEIISHGVWLYYRFPLSYRDVQELLFERGIDVTHEAIRQWCLGSVSKVEMVTLMALIYKVLFPSLSTFETPPDGNNTWEITVKEGTLSTFETIPR